MLICMCDGHLIANVEHSGSTANLKKKKVRTFKKKKLEHLVINPRDISTRDGAFLQRHALPVTGHIAIT